MRPDLQRLHWRRRHFGEADSEPVSPARLGPTRMSYDACGAGAISMAATTSGAARERSRTARTTWGYTGHEQMDQLGLVHMNARLYDPITGRHVSADPTVPDLANQQAFNGFSYVLNNALASTGPTEFGPEAVFTRPSNPLFGFADQNAECAWGKLSGHRRRTSICRRTSNCRCAICIRSEK